MQQAPGYAPAWAMLAILYREEYNHGFNPRPDSLSRALAAARRALEASPADHLAYLALASIQFFKRELEDFEPPRNERSRSTQWTDTPSDTWACLRLLPETGSAVVRCRSRLEASIPIIQDGIGSRLSSMPIEKATTEARWASLKRSICPRSGA